MFPKPYFAISKKYALILLKNVVVFNRGVGVFSGNMLQPVRIALSVFRNCVATLVLSVRILHHRV